MMTVKEIRDLVKVNGAGIGGIATSELSTGIEILGMSETIQSFGTTGIVIVILAYNLVKLAGAARKAYWDEEDRRNAKKDSP